MQARTGLALFDSAGPGKIGAKSLEIRRCPPIRNTGQAMPRSCWTGTDPVLFAREALLERRLAEKSTRDDFEKESYGTRDDLLKDAKLLE